MAEKYRKYLPPIKILGTSAFIVVLLGYAFDGLREPLDIPDSVLANAIPFISRFIAVILLFILVIFMVALRFNGKLPYRTYRPVELTIILGIVCGVVLLLQPFQRIAYKYGFLLLLASTISFILWSHVRPQNLTLGARLPTFRRHHHIIGLVIALAVVAGVTAYIANIEKPEVPYSYTDIEWRRYICQRMDEAVCSSAPDYSESEWLTTVCPTAERLREDQCLKVYNDVTAIIEKADNTYQRFSIPFFIFLGLFPGSVAYFLTREIAAASLSDVSLSQQASPATT